MTISSSIRDSAILTYDADTALGLRFRLVPTLTSTIEAIEIIGASDVTGSTVTVMMPHPGDELHYELPSGHELTEEELRTERAIHGLEEGSWLSSRVQKLVLHQRKRWSGGIEVSAFVALAALQETLVAPLVYFGEHYAIVIDNDRASILRQEEHVEIAIDSYLCGPALTLSLLEEYGNTARRLTFGAAGIQLTAAVAEYLHGLDHLFALAMGGAILSSLETSVTS